MNDKPLPEQCCARCVYSECAQLPPPNIQTVRQCKAFPPTPIMVQTAQGANMLAMWPIVQDEMHCYQFAPDDGVDPDREPSGLLVPDGT